LSGLGNDFVKGRAGQRVDGGVLEEKILDVEIGSFEKFVPGTERNVKVFDRIERTQVLLQPCQIALQRFLGEAGDGRLTGGNSLLTVSEKGFGKRSSSYDFRISGRGGKGIRATDTSKTGEIGELVAAFPVEDGDQIMLVSDGGQLIRVPVGGIRVASRATKGVTIFSTAKDEKVVSVERISEPEGDEDDVSAAEDDAVAGDAGSEGGSEE